MFLGSITFSSTVRSASRFENWKMNPSFEFLNADTSLSESFVAFFPSMNTLPLDGWSSSPIMLSNVDLPEPELPTINKNYPRFTENDTSLNACTFVSPWQKTLLTFFSSNTTSDIAHCLHWL